ncbi:MAG: regulator [Gammaproteobacteria bacterium]
MSHYNFDDRNVHWYPLGNFEHFVCSVLDVDRECGSVDLLLKFEPHNQIVLHRHCVLNKTLVIQGEHRLYEANGAIKEIRPVGRYTHSPASPDPHRECGGDDGAVVFFSIRGGDGVFYEILDDDLNTIATLDMQNFIDLYEAHKPQT